MRRVDSRDFPSGVMAKQLMGRRGMTRVPESRFRRPSPPNGCKLIVTARQGVGRRSAERLEVVAREMGARRLPSSSKIRFVEGGPGVTRQCARHYADKCSPRVMSVNGLRRRREGRWRSVASKRSRRPWRLSSGGAQESWIRRGLSASVLQPAALRTLCGRYVAFAAGVQERGMEPLMEDRLRLSGIQIARRRVVLARRHPRYPIELARATRFELRRIIPSAAYARAPAASPRIRRARSL